MSPCNFMLFIYFICYSYFVRYHKKRNLWFRIVKIGERFKDCIGKMFGEKICISPCSATSLGSTVRKREVHQLIRKLPLTKWVWKLSASPFNMTQPLPYTNPLLNSCLSFIRDANGKGYRGPSCLTNCIN